MKCHGPTGLGDGQQDDYDDWSKATKKFIDGHDAMVDEIDAKKQELAELKGEERDAAEGRTGADKQRARPSGKS